MSHGLRSNGNANPKVTGVPRRRCRINHGLRQAVDRGAVAADSGTLGVSLAVPETGSLPLEAPLAVQAVALVADQVSEATSPTVTEVGRTAMVTVGAGVGGAVAVSER